MDIWQERAENDLNYNSVIDPNEKSGLKSSYLKTVHEKALKKILSSKNDIKLLDFGCGVGRVLEYGLFKNIEYFGIDLSREMILKAKEKWKNREKSAFHIFDGHEIPFESEYFDVVISTWVFQHIKSDETLKNITKEIYRTLKPYGILIFIEQIRDKSSIEFTDNGNFLKIYRSADQYYNLFNEYFNIKEYEYLPGTGNGLFYNSLNILRFQFIKTFIPLFVFMDALIYKIFFNYNDFLRNLYIGRKWMDCLFYFVKKE